MIDGVERKITEALEPEFRRKAKRMTDAELGVFFGIDKQTAYRTRVRLGITKEKQHATRATPQDAA